MRVGAGESSQRDMRCDAKECRRPVGLSHAEDVWVFQGRSGGVLEVPIAGAGAGGAAAAEGATEAASRGE
jgi:hypothetical protein